MRMNVKPSVAVAIIVVAVLVIGFVLYQRNFGPGGKPFKPADAMSIPGFKEGLQKRYNEEMQKRQATAPQ